MKAFFACAVVLFVSCSSSPVPRGVLKPGEMKKAMYDLMQVDEFLNDFAVKDSSVNMKAKRSEMYEQVFAINKTSRKQFYSSLRYYQEHPDLNKVLFDSLQAIKNVPPVQKKLEPSAR